MSDAGECVHFVLVEDESLTGREPVLGKAKSRTLVEPDHLLDVIQEIIKLVDCGIGGDPGTLFLGQQRVSAASCPLRVRVTLGCGCLTVKRGSMR
jgi:hypothetical protein